MRVLMVEPMKTAYVKEIDGSLKSMQALVKGTIQAIYPFDDRVALVCNDDGKILGMQPNRNLPESLDVIAGPFFICGVEREDFISLTDEQVERYMKRFQDPEVIMATQEGILVIKIPEGTEERTMEEPSFRPFDKRPGRSR